MSDSLLSLLGEPEAYSFVSSSIVSWRMILAICRRVRSSFLQVLSVSSDLSSQHLISLLVYHFLIIILEFVILFCWHRFSRLGSFVLYWIVTSDSQSFYSGKDTLLYSSVGDFWVVCSARSRCLFTVGLLGSIVLVHLRRSSVFPASSLKREVG